MDYKLRKTDADVLICEGARVTGDVTLGRGVSVWYNAVLRGDDGAIVVGEDTNVQDAAILHEETRVGRGCTIGHGAIVHGCTVGDNVLIGMGAIVLNGARIGNDCIVGAGALVTGKLDAPDGSMILGSPAKVVRPLTAEEIERNRDSARNYCAFARGRREWEFGK
ncbi:MAG: gamma carbonic anhydrase family protein [Oscillibacter sp.]|nr:gamma carbonic anhydrase family protein [Oscillibacter sp.]